MKIALALASVLLVMPAAASAGPLDNARDGSLQCYEPDALQKTCKSLAGYTFGKQQILSQAEVLVSPTPPLVVKFVSPVQIRGDAVCGPLRKKDVEAAVIVFQGKVLKGADAANIRGQLLTAFGPRLEKEVCTTYHKQGDLLVTAVTIAGVSYPDLRQPVIWVKPSEGYRVGP